MKNITFNKFNSSILSLHKKFAFFINQNSFKQLNKYLKTNRDKVRNPVKLSFIGILFFLIFPLTIQAQCNVETINADFEFPVVATSATYINQNSYPNQLGWKTTATDGILEFWISGGQYNRTAYSGNQFVELNATQASGLYQDYDTSVATYFNYSFAHMGRDGVDTMVLKAGPPGGPYNIIETASTGKDGWKLYSGKYSVPNNQNTTRFIFEALSSSTGNLSVGNFLDAVNFTATIDPPVITGGTEKTICPNTSTTFTASGNNGSIFSWYDATGTILLYKGSQFTTPILQNDTNYKVKQKNTSNCESISLDIKVKVNLSTTTINYPATSYSSTEGEISINRVGKAGGKYTSTPAGLNIDENTGTINTRNSLENNYTVVYTFADGGCTNTSQTTIKISSPKIVSWLLVNDQNGNGTAEPGETLTYILRVSNIDPNRVTLQNVTGSIDLPAHTTLVNQSDLIYTTPSTFKFSDTYLPYSWDLTYQREPYLRITVKTDCDLTGVSQIETIGRIYVDGIEIKTSLPPIPVSSDGNWDIISGNLKHQNPPTLANCANPAGCPTALPVSTTKVAVLNINNPNPICTPNTVDLTTTVNTNSTPGTLTYWINALATIPLTNPTAVTVSGTYYIKSTSAQGCETIKPVVVTVNSKPETPVIINTAPSCIATGTSKINNYTSSNTYNFTPIGPTVDNLGQISGMLIGQSYTVTSSNSTCTSASSLSFKNDAQLATIQTPLVITTNANCIAPGTSKITNYINGNIYAFTPVGPTVDNTGQISGMLIGQSYTVTSSNSTCTSGSSLSFNNAAQLPTTATPTITTTVPTCVAPGKSKINNYINDNIYTFTPVGPTVDNTGQISGMVTGTSYNVTSTSPDRNCVSLASASFINNDILHTIGCFPVITTDVRSLTSSICNIPNEIVSYEIKIINSGAQNAENVALDFIFPNGIIFDSATASYTNGSSGPTGSLSLGNNTYNPILGNFTIPYNGIVTILLKGKTTTTTISGTHSIDAQVTYLDPTRTSGSPDRRITPFINAYFGTKTYEVGGSNVPGSNFAGASTSADDIIIKPKTTTVTTKENICFGESYVWSVDGKTYNTSGTYTLNNNGCTADQVLELTVGTKPATVTTKQNICFGDSFVWSVDGKTYTNSGTYTLNNNGCTADQVLELTVGTKPATVTTKQNICFGDSFVWSVDGKTYTNSGTYTLNNNGCTADQVLELTVGTKPATVTTKENICYGDSYLWSVDGKTYNTSGTYTLNNNGCTADQVLELTVGTKPATVTTKENICYGDSYLWSVDGKTYNTSGTYTLNNNGCTADQVLELTVGTKPATVTTKQNICFGDSFVVCRWKNVY
jgi:hypothetical protein